MRLMVMLVLGMFAPGCMPAAEAPLSFEEARVRLPVPGTDKSVGYFDVTNNTGTPITLVGARAVGVRAIEFHTMIRDGDLLRMRRLKDVEVAAGATVKFVPGGKHLMMFGVSELGQDVDIVLTDSDGADYTHTFRTFSATGVQ